MSTQPQSDTPTIHHPAASSTTKHEEAAQGTVTISKVSDFPKSKLFSSFSGKSRPYDPKEEGDERR